jgi:putative BNR repeat neuraminidase
MRVVLVVGLMLGCAAVGAQGGKGMADAHENTAERVEGYKGIWFDLGQRSTYGSKYSGGLGTYTAKHRPLAIYSEEAQKTFFVYGGTTAGNERHLLAMVSYFDHRTGQVPKPVLLHDKEGVDDPHDDPSIALDERGYVWVFVSGRSTRRLGYIYRSLRPYDIAAFEQLAEEEFTYPQPCWIEGKGFLLLFTQYTNGRELYWRAGSADGASWNPNQKLAGMGGHYQMSEERDGRVITAFNMHPKGNVDKRTNLYFLQTDDRGETWTTVDGTPVTPPLADPACAALVHDYASKNRLVYLKDICFDRKGRPVLLYITSAHHQPGPDGDPRVWTIAHWSGAAWEFHEVTTSTHNYDMGSLYIEKDGTWRVIGPTEAGPQQHGTGGEMAMWVSKNEGGSWSKMRGLTRNSARNHAYARRPLNAHPDFYAFWADGNPDEMSESHLYFCNKRGDVWGLPYSMEEDTATPVRCFAE